jgi:NAD(P)-dependent dehydrogenase (short-subunit alcohol dehydrogenase family)
MAKALLLIVMASLAHKTALITGASGGLGAHFAKVLARAGAHVILAARRNSALVAVAESVTAMGGTCHCVNLDVTDAGSVKALSGALTAVDIVVNNAGLVRSGPALDQNETDWDTVMDTNLKGMFLVAQTAGAAIRSRGNGGSIINVASILGIRQIGGVLPYAVSKAGVIQMTKTLALELARFRIRVNALAPGYIDTPMNREFLDSDQGRELIKRIPQRRLGRLEELDGPLLLLASDASSYMTGSVLTVDGGHLVSSL